MFVWYLLNTLSQPGHADFFHHHATDPGYTAWRAEADRQAAADPSVRQKLAELDTRLTAMQAQPRSSDYVPPGTPPSVALAADREADDAGWGLGFLLLLVVVGGVIWLAWRRLGASRRAREAEGASDQTSGTSYRPDWFRVGMTVPVDPTPFILAANMTHVRAPEGATDSGLLSVEAVGEVSTDGVRWHRLYLPGGQGFFQVHLDAAGRPDECRYFSVLDAIVPASRRRVGLLARCGRGSHWLAGVSDQGRQGLQPGVVPGRQTRCAARSHGNADERYWHHEPGTAGDALRGADRG